MVSTNASDIAEVALGSGCEPLTDLVRSMGWQTGGDTADVRLIDAAAGPKAVAAEGVIAARARAALVVLLAREEDAADAFDAGATHVCLASADSPSLAVTLRFAARYARRLRGTGRFRRAGEASEGGVERFVEALPPDEPAAVAVISISRFDTVNVAYGRSAGDSLLHQAGARLARTLPETAVMERDNGAGFIVALRGDNAEASARIAAMEIALGQRFSLGREEASVGARIGLAHRSGGEAAESLVRRARDALMLASTGEGAAVRTAAEPLAGDGIDLAADLHRAMDRGEIDILFQPQVALASDRIVGVEALARWEHPRHSVLGASTLFAAAARAGLGLALSEHIQSLALRRAGAWRGALAELRVAVNVTATDLARTDFADHFLAMIARADIAPDRVTAEVTESGMVTDLPVAAERLQQLRDAGVRVAIDDFGTGYSSLAYLKALPLDYLKIDRSITQDIMGGPRARVVVRGVIAIAAGLGLHTIAEGVESAAERDLLAAEGCDLYQGFLRAGPVDERTLAQLVEGEDT
jgi:predicted signal transduction protein with EAL and GGDEF domain